MKEVEGSGYPPNPVHCQVSPANSSINLRYSLEQCPAISDRGSYLEMRFQKLPECFNQAQRVSGLPKPWTYSRIPHHVRRTRLFLTSRNFE